MVFTTYNTGDAWGMVYFLKPHQTKLQDLTNRNYPQLTKIVWLNAKPLQSNLRPLVIIGGTPELM